MTTAFQNAFWSHQCRAERSIIQLQPPTEPRSEDRGMRIQLSGEKHSEVVSLKSLEDYKSFWRRLDCDCDLELICWDFSLERVNEFCKLICIDQLMGGGNGRECRPPSCYNYAFVCILVMDKIFVTLSIHYVHCIAFRSQKINIHFYNLLCFIELNCTMIIFSLLKKCWEQN